MQSSLPSILAILQDYLDGQFTRRYILFLQKGVDTFEISAQTRVQLPLKPAQSLTLVYLRLPRAVADLGSALVVAAPRGENQKKKEEGEGEGEEKEEEEEKRKEKRKKRERVAKGVHQIQN